MRLRLPARGRRAVGRGAPARFRAASELNSLVETVYLLRSPMNAERLRKAMDRADAGEGVVMNVEELGRKFGLLEG